MHVGNAFASLMAWLAARAEGGRMVLRIEDLDDRCRDRAVAETLIDDLAWMGLSWDEGPFWQSAREDVYADAFERLEEQGLVYPCFCSRASLHAATAPHASDGTYVYQRTCRGLSPAEIERRRAERAPAMRLMVDGAEITQVVRGNDLLGSTARQMHVQRLLGLPNPGYGHVPLLVAADGRRLAKRDGDLDLGALRARGIAADRLVGWLGSLAGLVDEGAELTADELAAHFSWEKVRACGRQIVVDAESLSRYDS